MTCSSASREIGSIAFAQSTCWKPWIADEGSRIWKASCAFFWEGRYMEECACTFERECATMAFREDASASNIVGRLESA